MGFELDRIMKQYGVGTAGVVDYSGSTPEDTAAYDAYKKEFETRLQNTPMMMQAQYQTGNEPKSEALKYAINNMGVDQFNKNIQNWANLNPTAYSGDINAYAQKYGISGQDIFNATQNRWGNILQAPKFGAPTPVAPPVTPPPFVPPVRPPVVPPLPPVVPPEPPVIPPLPPELPPEPPEPPEPPPLPPEPPVIPEPPVVPEPEVEPPFVPSIYTKPIISDIPDEIVDPNKIPLIVPTTPLELPEIPYVTEPDKTDKSYWEDPDFVEVGPSRGLIKNQEELPEEFDKYLAPEVPSIPTITEKTGVVDVTAVDPNTIIPDTVGPNRAGGGDLPEEFDKYLSPETPAITTTTPTAVDTPAVIDTPTIIDNPYVNTPTVIDNPYVDTPTVIDNPYVNTPTMIDTPTITDDGTTNDIQDAIDNLNNSYSSFDFGGGSDYNTFGFNGGEDGGKYGDFGASFGGGGGGRFFDDNFSSFAAYAKGGPVKTHYQTAGSVQLPSGYSDAENEADWMERWARQQSPVETNPVNMSTPPAPVISEPIPAPAAPLTAVALNAAKNASAPVAPAVAPKPVPVSPPAFGAERMGNIQALLAAYGPKDGAYGEELKAARATAKAESDAFAKLLSDSMKSPQDEQSSKAEMYFRLAAAFGAPTKTGHFAENLGMVGKELGEYSKEKRASAQQKLALALKGQEMKMGAAKDDLRTLQALAGEEMKDKRAIATELIKDYIKSGEPQSTAGKQAVDEGLKPGTPEYQKRVETLGNMNIEGKLAQITASLAGVNTAAANLALAQEKFQNQKQQQTKLSPTEINMKKEAEDTIATGKQSLADLKQAYALNPNSLAGGWMDKGQQWLAEAAGSKDPTIVNTRILNNLLGAQGLAKLKSTFGGNPTEGERAIMLELEGIGSKTKEERAAIIKRTYKVLQDKQAREQTRLDQINSGAYRSTTPLDGGTE